MASEMMADCMGVLLMKQDEIYKALLAHVGYRFERDNDQEHCYQVGSYSSSGWDLDCCH
jgi:hypothetical protein